MFSKRSVIFIVLILSPTRLVTDHTGFCLNDQNYWIQTTAPLVTKTSLPSTPECGSFSIHSWTLICSTFSFIIFSWFSSFLTKPQFSLLCRFVFNCNTILSLVPPGMDLKRLFVSINVLSLDDLTHVLGVKIHLQIENLKNMSSVLISPQRLWWKKILWHLYLNVLKIFHTQHSKP